MAEEIIIAQGTGVLAGEVPVSGAKNSALKLMAASLLGGGTTAIHNVPLISDIAIMSEVLRCLNARVEREGHTLVVDTGSVDKWETPYELVSKMRASIAVLGPLIGRFGQARVAMPGGCQIGARKIDMHLVGLEALGVEFVVDHRLFGGHDAARPGRRARRAGLPQRGRHGEPAHGRRGGRGHHHRGERRARAGDRRSGETRRTPWARACPAAARRSSRWRACPSRACIPASTPRWATA